VRALTDATGTITQTYQRDPFGIVEKSGSPPPASKM
jgi:hypothetical protein